MICVSFAVDRMRSLDLARELMDSSESIAKVPWIEAESLFDPLRQLKALCARGPRVRGQGPSR
ncbi:MAG: hypothetical protein EBY29_11430 [Planctomycetes bacterium]|nr:hypothetical protein [Planctomycetota bacterium]